MVALLAACHLGGKALSRSAPQATTTTTAAAPAMDRSSTEFGASPGAPPPPADEEAGAIPPIVPVAVPDLPKPVAEIVLLAQRTLGESVLVHFVDTIQEPFELDGEQVIYLSDLGIPDGVISALLRRSQTLAGRSPVLSEEPMVADVGQPTPQTQSSEPTAAQYRATFQAPEANAPVYGQPQPVAQPPQQAGLGPEVAQGAAVQAPTQQVTYNVFYESLSPYGNWVQAPAYGWVWQPTVAVVNPGWQPYVHGGRWMWTDYGWYWNSTYSWGWAPFHYGRWHQSGVHGWVWVPGRSWGPAWVAWRYDAAYCGWAPLPPECYWSPGIGFSWMSRGSSVSVGFGIGLGAWAVAPWGGFCAPRLPVVCLPRESTGHFVNNTSIKVSEGQAVNIVGNNNTVIINNAVSRDQVQRHVREEIRKVAVTDAPTPGRASIAPRPASDGTSARPQIAAYRPQIQDSGGTPSAPPSSLLARQEERKYTATRPATSGRTETVGSAAAPGARSLVPTRDGQVSATRPGDSASRPNVAPSARDQSTPPSATRPGAGGAPGSDSLTARPNPSATRPSGAGVTAPSTGATRPDFASTRVAGSPSQGTAAVRPGTQTTYPGATTGVRPGQTQSQVPSSTVPGRPTSQSLPSAVPAARPQGSGIQSNYQQQQYQQQQYQQQQYQPQQIQRYPQRQEVPKAVPSYPGSMAPVPQTGRPVYNQNAYPAPATRGAAPAAARPGGVTTPSYSQPAPSYSRPVPSYSQPVQSAPSRSTYSRPSTPAPSPRLNSGSTGSSTRSVPSASRPTPVQSAPATRPSQ
jgi:hypothetical protein